MTRPDPRLLCPVDALPFVPGGVDKHWDGCAYTPEHADSHFFVDFSAPALRDGLPVRLDALAWGLLVLGVRASSIVGSVWGKPETFDISDPLFGAQGYIAREPWPRKQGRAFVLGDAWPDLSNLSPDDASRAVVVAALKARKVKL